MDQRPSSLPHAPLCGFFASVGVFFPSGLLACLPVCGSELVCLAKAVIYGSKLPERVPSPSDLETALERPLDFAKIIHTEKKKEDCAGRVQNMTLGVYVNHLPESPNSCISQSSSPSPSASLCSPRVCSTAMLTMTNTHTSPQKPLSIYQVHISRRHICTFWPAGECG